jgi:hypothetical protein
VPKPWKYRSKISLPQIARLRKSHFIAIGKPALLCFTTRNTWLGLGMLETLQEPICGSSEIVLNLFDFVCLFRSNAAEMVLSVRFADRHQWCNGSVCVCHHEQTTGQHVSYFA